MSPKVGLAVIKTTSINQCAAEWCSVLRIRLLPAQKLGLRRYSDYHKSELLKRQSVAKSWWCSVLLSQCVAVCSRCIAVCCSVLQCDPRVRKIRNEAFSCFGIFTRTLHFGRAASGGALAPEPPRAAGVKPQVISIQFCHFFHIFEIGQSFNILSRDLTRFILAFPGSVLPK